MTFPIKTILVVLYKCDLTASSTIGSLVASKAWLRRSDKLIVWDNSPASQSVDDVKFLNDEFSSLCSIEYMATRENVPLASLYNRVLRTCPIGSFLFLFDQDSHFSHHIFEQFELAVVRNPTVNLFLPIVKDGDRIVSPADFILFKGRYWQARLTGLVSAKRKLAITSGMIVNSDYARKNFFDEGLNFYGVDTNFMLRYSNYNKYFYVLDVDLDHSLSLYLEERLDVKLFRFKSHKKALMYNSHLLPLHSKLLTYLYVGYLMLRSAVEYKDLRFLK